jgi:hypothetical protein
VIYSNLSDGKSLEVMMSGTEIADVYYSEGRGTATPWGRSQYSQQLARGAIWYGAAGHGGLSVSLSWAQKNLTPHARYLGEFWGGKLWYEEDCACYVVFLEHPDLLQRKHGGTPVVKRIKASVERWNPRYFDKEFQEAAAKAGVVPTPKDLENRDKLVVFAYGSPNNERVYTLLGTYAKGKGALVEDECLGRYKLTASVINNNMIRVERDGEVIWERP